jgi:hypothetical protein
MCVKARWARSSVQFRKPRSGPALGRDNHSAASLQYVKRSSRDQSIPHLLLGLAEVDVEILELGGPAVQPHPMVPSTPAPAVQPAFTSLKVPVTDAPGAVIVAVSLT